LRTLRLFLPWKAGPNFEGISSPKVLFERLRIYKVDFGFVKKEQRGVMCWVSPNSISFLDKSSSTMFK